MSKKLIFFLIILLNVYFVYSVIDVPSNVVISGCGDNICNGNESCSNCEIDCGECFIPGGFGGGSSGGRGGGGKLPNGEIIDKPIESITTCSEYWICNEWNECNNGKQARSCYDLYECNTSLNKPVEEKECEIEIKEEINEEREKNYYLVIFFIVFILLISYILLRKERKIKRKKRK